MASSIAAITMPRSIDFSRATASAICSNSSLLALTAAMALVSSGGIDFAPAPSFGGEAVLLGVFRGVLAHAFRLQFRLRFIAFRRVAFPGMGRRWRREAEIAAQLALRSLAAPHRFRDQLVGQNQPCLRDIFHHEHNIGIFPRGRVIAMQPYDIALEDRKSTRLNSSHSSISYAVFCLK